MRFYSVCLSLTDFTEHDAVEVHLCCHKWQDFTFLWPNNILLYRDISRHIYMSIPECVSVCINTQSAYIPLSIHLLIDTMLFPYIGYSK